MLHKQLRDHQEAKAGADDEISGLKGCPDKAIASGSSVGRPSNPLNGILALQFSTQPIEFGIDAGNLAEDDVQNLTKEEVEQLQALSCSLRNEAKSFRSRFFASLTPNAIHASKHPRDNGHYLGPGEINACEAKSASQTNGSADVPDAASMMISDLQEPDGINMTTFANGADRAAKSGMRRSIRRRHTFS